MAEIIIEPPPPPTTTNTNNLVNNDTNNNDKNVINLDADQTRLSASSQTIFFRVTSPTRIPNIYQNRYVSDFIECRFIASGAFGSVFEAQHKIDKQKYAIKKCDKSNGISAKESECEIMAQLRDPHVILYTTSWYEHPDNSNYNNNYSCINIKSIISSMKPMTIQNYNNNNNSNSNINSDDGDDDNVSTSREEWNNDPMFNGGNNSNILLPVPPPSSSATLSSSSSSSSSPSIIIKSNSSSTTPYVPSYQTQSAAASSSSSLNIILYIQMELAEGNLRTLMDKSNITRAQCKEIIWQVLHGLKYIHEKGYVHRDIKPENIFYFPDQVYKIGDFGISIPISQLSQNINNQKNLGTLYYASPAQWSGEAYDERTDFHSVAVIYYELLSKSLWDASGERLVRLKQMKKDTGILNDQRFNQNYPDEAEFIQTLFTKNWNIVQILSSSLFNLKST